MTLKARFDLDVWAAKRKLFDELAESTEVYVHINLDTEGVRVPERFTKSEDRTLILKFSPRYDYRLEVLEEGVSQILKLGGEDFEVFIAWDAMFAIRDERAIKVGQWHWSAPMAKRPDRPVLMTTESGHELVITPEGVVFEPTYSH